MPLESCMILLDTSQYMRNSDYIPTRLHAQADAANLLAGAVLQNNNESTVGIAAAASVLVSPTAAVGKILTAVHNVRVPSTAPVDSIPQAVAVASLALKHRRNKLGGQRVVCFVGTPVTEDVKALQKTGRMLRKNNVTLDIVGLGEHEGNKEKLQALVDAANGSTENSENMGHYVPVPEGVVPSDVLASSPILGAGGAGAVAGGAAVAAAANGFADFGGVDPNMDPELAMALRVSMEEERARQERAVPQDGEEAAAPAVDETGAPELSEDEALLQQALAMSMNENEPSGGGVEDGKGEEEDALMEDTAEELDEDAATQMALQMSMQNDVQDPEFVQGMLDDMKEDNEKDKKGEDKKE